MGIESLNGVNGTSTYQTAAPVKEVKQSIKEVNQPDKVEQVVDKSSENSSASSLSQVATAQAEDEKQIVADNEALKMKNENSMKNAAKDINKLINNNTKAEFGYHESTHRITIKIKDKSTDEVIKEIPSEKALQMLEKAWELAGMLVDEKR